MRYFEKIAKKKKTQLEINKDVVGASVLTASGAGYTGKKIKDISTQKVTLNPESKRVAVFYPGGSSGAGHKVPAKEFIRQLHQKGYLVDIYDTDLYQGNLARKFITPAYIKTVSTDPISAMPTQTEVDPDVRLGKTEPLWKQLKKIEKEKGLSKPQSFGQNLKLEIWNAIAGHNQAEKEFRLKGRRSGGYNRVFSFFGPTSDIVKHTGVPVDVIQTDFLQNPLIWKSEAGSRYFVPNKISKDRYKQIGFPDAKVVETGSLIVGKEFKEPEKYFTLPEDLKRIKTENPKARFVTVTGGGAGINVDLLTEQLSKYYERKDPNVRVVSIAGGNTDVFDKIQKKIKEGKLPNVVSKNLAPYGPYMYNSEYSLIRPGGSTTAEVLHLGKPAITVSQHNTPKKVSRLGAHEHGNIKQIVDTGTGLHFKTDYDMKKYNPGIFNNVLRFLKGNKAEITNISDLDKVLDTMESQYPKFRAAAEQTAKTYRGIDPVKTILSTPAASQRKTLIKILDKGKLGAGLGLLGLGGYLLNKSLKQRDRRKNIVKVSEVKDYWPYAIPPAVLLTAGAVAGKYVPGLRGGKGPVKGSFEATKRLFVDLPLNVVSGKKWGKNLEEVVFNANKIERLKLPPDEIINRGMATADKNLSKKMQRDTTKHLDSTITLQMIKEQEELARKAGVKKMVGVSHFTPAQAARLGYAESVSMTPTAAQALFGNKPLGYYDNERAKSLKKLLEHGPDKLDAMDAYWLSADTKHLRMFEKDLTIPEAQATEFAQKTLAKIPKKEIEDRIKGEKAFKVKFDSYINNIYK